MPTSEAQRKANKKWREANHDKYNEICRESVKNYYIENKDKISLYKQKLRIYKNQCALLRNIQI